MVCKKCGIKVKNGKEFCSGVCAIAYNAKKAINNINYAKRDVSGDFRW